MCTPTSGAYTALGKPPFKWSRTFGKHTLEPLPPSCQKTVAKSGFKGKTPQSGRPSICALAALTHLHESGKLDLAGEMWKSVILVPHSLVRNTSNVFLVVGQGRFATRAWLATKIPQSHSDLGRRWAFVPIERLVWIFVERVEDWWFIPMKWVVNSHETQTFGCLVAEERDEGHVPALAEALVTVGRSRLTMHDRKTLTGGGRAVEVQKMEELLHGHPQLPHYLKRLNEWHDEMEAKARRRQRRARQKANNLDQGEGPPPSSQSSSEAEEVDPRLKALTCAALQELDEVNLRECKTDKAINHLMGQRVVRHAARQVLRRERAKRQPVECCTNLRVVRCNVPWARRYVPGTAESGTTVPEGCKQSCLGAPPTRFVWVARYRHPLLQQVEARPTRSKSFTTPPSGEKTVVVDKDTEHCAFQVVLGWLWDRHEEVCPDWPSQPPARVGVHGLGPVLHVHHITRGLQLHVWTEGVGSSDHGEGSNGGPRR